MSTETSIADNLVSFMRSRDEARDKIEVLPEGSDAKFQLSSLLDQQERAVKDIMHRATMATYQLGRLAESWATATAQEKR